MAADLSGRGGGAAFRDAFASFRRTAVFDRFERGLAAEEEFFRAVREHFGAADVSGEEIRSQYLRILGDEVEGMRGVVDDLRRAGVRAAALTDTSPLHLGALARYPIVRSMEALIASCETGRRKPDPEAFLDAVRRLSASPEEVFFTDDTPANVEGARAAGLRAEVFRGPEELRARLGLRSG